METISELQILPKQVAEIALEELVLGLEREGITSELVEEEASLGRLGSAAAQVTNYETSGETVDKGVWPLMRDFYLSPEKFRERFIKPEIQKLVQGIAQKAATRKIRSFRTPLYCGLDFAERAEGRGISLRALRVYDIFEDSSPIRYDVLFQIIQAPLMPDSLPKSYPRQDYLRNIADRIAAGNMQSIRCMECDAKFYADATKVDEGPAMTVLDDIRFACPACMTKAKALNA